MKLNEKVTVTSALCRLRSNVQLIEPYREIGGLNVQARTELLK